MEHTLNPKQISEAIEKGEITAIRFNSHYMTFEQNIKEGKDFVFSIGEESYYCTDGKITVHYDFELSEKDILLLRKKALESVRDDELKSLKVIEDTLFETKNEICKQEN